MELLLDTHAFIWFINGDDSLPDNVREAIKDVRNKCFLSIASLWEITIKTSLGKLELKSDFNKVVDLLSANDIDILPITFEHLQKLLNLKYHHRDPLRQHYNCTGYSREVDGLDQGRELKEISRQDNVGIKPTAAICFEILKPGRLATTYTDKNKST